MDGTERLSVHATVDEDGTIAVVGDLDAYTVGDLELELQRLADDQDVRLDLSGVAFMDSSGIRALVRLDNRLRSGGHQVIVIAPSTPVLRLFELTGLVDRFRFAMSAT